MKLGESVSRTFLGTFNVVQENKRMQTRNSARWRKYTKYVSQGSCMCVIKKQTRKNKNKGRAVDKKKLTKLGENMFAYQKKKVKGLRDAG